MYNYLSKLSIVGVLIVQYIYTILYIRINAFCTRLINDQVKSVKSLMNIMSNDDISKWQSESLKKFAAMSEDEKEAVSALLQISQPQETQILNENIHKNIVFSTSGKIPDTLYFAYIILQILFFR